MATLDDLLTYLAAEGVGTEGTDLFYGMMGPNPDACVVLFETGGLAPERALGATAVRIERVGIMIHARGSEDDYNGPRAKIQAAWDAMVDIETQTLTSTFYERCDAIQSPFVVDKDINDRYLFSANFIVEKEP